MSVLHGLEEPRPVRLRFALFEYGFRPFFLGAALMAALAIPLWLLRWLGAFELDSNWMPSLWHAHEMLFGFAAAALAGFLLTAVPSWTGAPALRGAPLAFLAGIWLLGRLLAYAGGEVGAALFAAVDLAFLPLLAVAVAPAIMAGSARRNGLFILLLALLFLANLTMHLEALGWADDSAGAGLRLALGLFLLMITLIGGRILPAFTASGLKAAGIAAELRPAPALDKAAILATALLAIVFTLADAGPATAVLAVLAALAHAARLARWAGWKARRIPLLWILHLAYAWLILGLALLAAASLSAAVPLSAALHALAAGAIASMVLGVTSRAALGHTGRPLATGPTTVAAYVLVLLGAALRVAAPFLPGDGQIHAIGAGGLLWSAGFVCFLAVYLPILVGPRADGRPG
jgi:uncharacterized protein involved in response to NO